MDIYVEFFVIHLDDTRNYTETNEKLSLMIPLLRGRYYVSGATRGMLENDKYKITRAYIFVLGESRYTCWHKRNRD